MSSRRSPIGRISRDLPESVQVLALENSADVVPHCDAAENPDRPNITTVTADEQQFDILALDAFSSDAIPVHLLTRESFAIYLKHMKPDGVIAVHTSNRNLDLRPVVENLADYFHMRAATIFEANSSGTSTSE